MEDRRMRRARDCSLPALSLLLFSASTFAAEFSVNQTLDDIDTTPGDGICETASGGCSLRAAIMESNALAGADNISLPAGTYPLSLIGTGENQSAEGDLDVLDDLTLTGTGADQSIIDAAHAARGFHLLAKSNGERPTVTLRHIGLQNGLHGQSTQGSLLWNQANLTLDSVHINASGDGSTAVRNEAQLTLENSTLSDNTRALINSSGRVLARNSSFSDNGSDASSLDGAGLYNFEGRVTLEGTSFSGNAARNGGGLYSVGGDVFGSGLTFSGNRANAGGGLFNSTSRVVIGTSLFDGNKATRSSGSHGGAIASTGSLYLSDSLVSGNQSNSLGGGISIKDGRLALSRVDLLDNQILASTGDGGGLGIRGLADGEIARLHTLTVRGNQAGDSGGGIFSASDFQLKSSELSTNLAARGAGLASTALVGEIRNSSIASNAASTRGGGIYLGPTANRYALNLRHVTLSDNSAPTGKGANLSRYRGTLKLANSLLADPLGAANCDTNTTSLGGNIASDDSCGLSDASDQVTVDPQLQALADNGGDNQSLQPGAASPAIDSGLGAQCLPVDQRGHYRAGDCDAGAVEIGSAAADSGSISFAHAAHSLREDDLPLEIGLLRNGAAEGEISLRVFDLSGFGEAEPGKDYTPVDVLLQWADGEGGAKTVSVAPIDDALEENTESLFLSVLGPLGQAPAVKPVTTAIQLLDNDARPGELAFEQASYEVSESHARLNVIVQRSNGRFGAVSVDYATADLSATQGEDYRATQGTLHFEHGQQSANFSVPMLSDDMDEGDESFQLTLSSPTGGASLGEWQQVIASIIDDDQPQHGSFSFESGSASFAESDGEVSITVWRLDGSDGAVSVDYRSQANSADESDFQLLSGNLNFADGQASADITLKLIDDAQHEIDEQFSLVLDNPQGGAKLGATPELEIEIRDNDPVHPGKLSFSTTTASANENHGTLEIHVQRSSGTDGTVTVDFAAVDVSAKSGSDYLLASGTLQFADGESKATIQLQIIDDNVHEEAERLRLRLSNPSGGATIGDHPRQDITIVDNDPLPAPGTLHFDTSSISVVESSDTLRLTVLRSDGSDGSVSVDFETQSGSASADNDFHTASGSLQFADGQTSAEIELQLLDDEEVEGDERFSLQLRQPTGGASLSDPTRIDITLEDNDQPAVQAGRLGWEQATLSVSEVDGSLAITALRSDGSDGAVSVQWRTVADSASAGEDFIDASGVITFANGQSQAIINVQLLDDNQHEPEEQFSLLLSEPSGDATLGTPTSLSITISDNDVTPTPEPALIAFAAAELQLEESTGEVDVIVRRSGNLEAVVTLDYYSVDASAQAGSDFAELSGTLRFDAGETEATLRLTLLDDEQQEADERFSIELNVASGQATLGSPAKLSVVLLANDQKSNGGNDQGSESGGGGGLGGGLVLSFICLFLRRFGASPNAKLLCIAASVCSLHLRSNSHNMRHEWAPKCRTAREALDITNSTPPMENHRP